MPTVVRQKLETMVEASGGDQQVKIPDDPSILSKTRILFPENPADLLVHPQYGDEGEKVV